MPHKTFTETWKPKRILLEASWPGIYWEVRLLGAYSYYTLDILDRLWCLTLFLKKIYIFFPFGFMMQGGCFFFPESALSNFVLLRQMLESCHSLQAYSLQLWGIGKDTKEKGCAPSWGMSEHWAPDYPRGRTMCFSLRKCFSGPQLPAGSFCMDMRCSWNGIYGSDTVILRLVYLLQWVCLSRKGSCKASSDMTALLFLPS